jgi:hypothetical protein
LKRTCLDELSQARHKAIAKSFVKALTRGGSGNGAARPIEISAHDPLRYVGDMLGWIHQCAVNEREMLESLLELTPGDMQLIAVMWPNSII